MKKLYTVLVLLGVFSMGPFRGYSSSSLLTHYLRPSLTFSKESFDGLAKDYQLQVLRDFFYSLPLSIESEEDKAALTWLQEKALVNPSLAYTTARVLQVRGYPSSQWHFFIHFALLSINICSSLCLQQKILQEKQPILILEAHAQKANLLDMASHEAGIVLQRIRSWRSTITWSQLPDASWIFCLSNTNSCIPYMGYDAISYAKHDRQFSELFMQSTHPNQATIEIICEQAYQTWIQSFCHKHGLQYHRQGGY